MKLWFGILIAACSLLHRGNSLKIPTSSFRTQEILFILVLQRQQTKEKYFERLEDFPNVLPTFNNENKELFRK